MLENKRDKNLPKKHGNVHGDIQSVAVSGHALPAPQHTIG
jgi:hypothetical protein